MGRNAKKTVSEQNSPEKLRIQLRNALIRSTLTYAMQTQELTEPQEKKSTALRKNA